MHVRYPSKRSLAYQLAVVWGLFLLLLPLLCWAQDVLVPPPAPPAPVVDAVVVEQLLAAVGAGKWVLALVLVLNLVVGLVRGPILRMLPEHTAFRRWAEGRWGGWALNLVANLAAASVVLAAAAAAGTSVTAALVVSTYLGAVVTSLTAAGAYQARQDISDSRAAARATVAAQPQTLEQMADRLRGPNP